MADISLVKKLLVKPGQKVAIVNAPAGFIRSLGEMPPDATVTETLNVPVDFAMLFTQTSKGCGAPGT